MKKLLLIVVMLLSGCTHPLLTPSSHSQGQSYYNGGNGTSFAEAVTFPDAKSSADGVRLERKWLTERYPGYRKGMQRTLIHEGKRYDIQSIITPSGQELDFYFDITSWFGFGH